MLFAVSPRVASYFWRRLDGDAESVASAVPATAAKAQLMLDLAARKPQDVQYASWMLPLAANALLNAAPPAAPHLWLQVLPWPCLQDSHKCSMAAALTLHAHHQYSDHDSEVQQLTRYASIASGCIRFCLLKA